jgi:hypothetical protein
MIRRILLGILALLLGLAVLAVVIDESCSRNETEWADQGWRHVEEMVSGKQSDGD